MRVKKSIYNKKVLIVLLYPIILYSFTDSDLDGVEDKYDKCPNSDIFDIVNQDGCTIEKLRVNSNPSNSFDIIIGTKIDNSNIDTTYQLDYYYKNWNIGLNSIYYNNNQLGDTNLNISYKILSSIYIGTSAIFPTYKSDLNNNRLDYKIFSSFNYPFKNNYIFAGFSYTFINDKDINTTDYNIKYKNSTNYYLGLAKYIFDNLYSSISYINSSGIYDEDDTNSISFYNQYTIDKSFFAIFGYNKCFKREYKDSLSIKLGYFF